LRKRRGSAGVHDRAVPRGHPLKGSTVRRTDKLFTVVDHELPGHKQLEDIARGIATQDGELPVGDELARVIEAAAGLTASEAENAYSLALVRHGTLEPETLWELKTQQLKKSGLVSLHRGTESFDQLGGLDNLKLGNETGRPTVILDVGALLGSQVGQSESNVRAALKLADAMEAHQDMSPRRVSRNTGS